jgi:formylglycine-generating enzyme required for sulfatase activity
VVQVDDDKVIAYLENPQDQQALIGILDFEEVPGLDIAREFAAIDFQDGIWIAWPIGVAHAQLHLLAVANPQSVDSFFDCRKELSHPGNDRETLSVGPDCLAFGVANAVVQLHVHSGPNPETVTQTYVLWFCRCRHATAHNNRVAAYASGSRRQPAIVVGAVRQKSGLTPSAPSTLAARRPCRKLVAVFTRNGFVFLLCLTLPGCKEPDPSGAIAAMQASRPRPSSEPSDGRHPTHVPLAQERVEIPTGAFEAGTLPGAEGRHPQLEQLLATVELGPFSIDRLPFPNDPKVAPLTNVTRAEAAARCSERAARLCTELEWERACKGPRNDSYSTGARFEGNCSASAAECASGFDVLGLGTTLREWTASNAISATVGVSKGAAIRGAAATSPATDHRCARRDIIKETERASDLGFRCCHGPPNAARVEEPELRAVFERPTFDSNKMATLLEGHPKTKLLAKEWTFFREPDAAETVVSRGPGDRQGLRFTVAPLLWSPVAGTRFLLITGRSGKDTSAVLAFHVIRDGDYRLAASFIMRNEPGPVALAYHESIRPRLFFSTCWKCPGETGRLLYRDPDAVAIVQP